MYRCRARGIKTKLYHYTLNSPTSLLEKADIFLMNGAEDRHQQIVAKDFDKKKLKIFKEKIKAQTPGLFICGAYQFLGSKYIAKNNQTVNGLNLYNFYTTATKYKNNIRLIGEIVVKITNKKMLKNPIFSRHNYQYLIGFENHNGRTFLPDNKQALGKTVLGYGNNDFDHYEGLYFNNLVATYLHGPILPRNIALCDFLIEKALLAKYNQTVNLKPLNDQLEQKNRDYLLKKLNVKVEF